MGWNTHEVTNQVPDLVDHNLYEVDRVLQEAVLREGAEPAVPALTEYGVQLGRADMRALAAEINRQGPELRPYDRRGHRIDEVSFHAGWHRFLELGCSHGLHHPASVARAAAFLMHGQVEAGSLCPLTMTSAAAPLLAREPWFDTVAAQLSSHQYDRRDIAVGNKHGMLVGMGLTEKQGGSDLRRITTQARRDAADGAWFRLTGHKWFFSVPTADAHLVLAQADGQPSCFYVPRRMPDGTLNAIRLMQLKDKLGNRSNASAEVEFEEAFGMLVGEPGRGIAILAEMASHTRLDCVLGSTALMRAALVEALHHCSHRVAFGRPLQQQALMRTVLVDLALEVEAAVTLAMRLARSVSAGRGASMVEQAMARIITPAAKFWVCKRAITVIAEAMEVLGGNGYVETHGMARLYREAPVNSIWEGSGNIMCLDVLRGIHRHPDLAEALFQWLRDESGDETPLLNRLNSLETHSRRPLQEQEAVARNVAANLVLLVQAVLLRRHAPQPVADAFIASRLDDNMGVMGLSATPTALAQVLDRAWRAAS